VVMVCIDVVRGLQLLKRPLVLIAVGWWRFCTRNCVTEFSLAAVSVRLEQTLTAEM
jgi:hypothetical protein